jgi:hypothetical protein
MKHLLTILNIKLSTKEIFDVIKQYCIDTTFLTTVNCNYFSIKFQRYCNVVHSQKIALLLNCKFLMPRLDLDSLELDLSNRTGGVGLGELLIVFIFILLLYSRRQKNISRPKYFPLLHSRSLRAKEDCLQDFIHLKWLLFFKIVFYSSRDAWHAEICFMTHGHISWPRSVDLGGSRIRIRDSCVLCQNLTYVKKN